MKNPVSKFMERFNKPKVEEDSREKLLYKISKLEAELEEFKPKPEVKKWLVGDRVKGNNQCGFNASMHGTVQYVEEASGKVWVRRDGSSRDVFYYAYELDAEAV